MNITARNDAKPYHIHSEIRMKYLEGANQGISKASNKVEKTINDKITTIKESVNTNTKENNDGREAPVGVDLTGLKDSPTITTLPLLLPPPTTCPFGSCQASVVGSITGRFPHHPPSTIFLRRWEGSAHTGSQPCGVARERRPSEGEGGGPHGPRPAYHPPPPSPRWYVT